MHIRKGGPMKRKYILPVCIFIAMLAGLLYFRNSAGNIPSLSTILKGNEQEAVQQLAGTDEETIYSAWGDPDEETVSFGLRKLTYRGNGGYVILTTENRICTDVSVYASNPGTWSFSHPFMYMLYIFLCTAVPFILLFLAVSVLFRKLGWIEGRDESALKRAWPFGAAEGFRPWSRP